MADAFLILSWIVASVYNKAAIEGMNLDPEDEEAENKRYKQGHPSEVEDEDGPPRA